MAERSDRCRVGRHGVIGEIASDNLRMHAVRAYKDLSRVERAFRSMKTVDLEIRPIRHWNADRVRAHVFLCMLAYHVEWHLRQALAPLLFHDTDLDAARAERSSVNRRGL
jgi:transposase